MTTRFLPARIQPPHSAAVLMAVLALVVGAGSSSCDAFSNVDETKLKDRDTLDAAADLLDSSSDGNPADTSLDALAPNPDNLLVNPDFEDWVSSALEGWEEEGSTLSPYDSPYTGDGAVLVTGGAWAGCDQWLTLETPLPAGSSIVASAWFRHVSGATEEPVISLGVSDSNSEDAEYLSGDIDEAAWAGGNWSYGEAAITVPENMAFDTVHLLLESNSREDIVFAIDAAALIVTSP